MGIGKPQSAAVRPRGLQAQELAQVRGGAGGVIHAPVIGGAAPGDNGVIHVQRLVAGKPNENGVIHMQ